MKRIIMGLVVLALVLGCQNSADEVVEKKMEADTGTEVDVESGDGDSKVTIQDESGTQQIQSKSKNEDEWCQKGSEWKMTDSEGSAEWMVQGIVTSGKYEGYCHVTYDVESDDTKANIDYYFNEEGSGYQVMEVNGEKYESEWTSG